ncbi:sigma-70 family RNA polymerase sigma factor [Leptospira levettii]|uniref:RNA polymerase sigma factor n=1 Tax=Leptospira levettii TaxID=2023178 RepID=UPI00223D1FC9|nr:sigma-70 family RNA polymerase sigma factor [Leptospira levettii]MCW7498470.1 sigma-70 family RNA polymerase sigma factor [Leptospira levettii]
MIVGSGSAWSEFVDEYYPVISGTVKQHSSNLDVEEIAQKLYLKCIQDEHEFLRNFKGNSKIAFKKYISETTKFIVWDLRTKNLKNRAKFSSSDEVLDSIVSKEPSPEEQYNSVEISETLMNAIMQLELKQREVIFLLMQGFTHKEISEKMKSPLNTVLSWSHRAKINLKNILKKEKILQ